MNLKDLPVEVVEAMLDSLNIDISFVDAQDTVKYFNTPKKGRVFPRTKMDLGRKVQKCHPPQSVDKVNFILDGFKNKTMDEAPFWFEHHGKFIYINYYPVYDNNGKYLGTLEVLQDITELKKLEGEKRLLDIDKK